MNRFPKPPARFRQQPVGLVGMQVKMTCNYGPFKEGQIFTVAQEGRDWIKSDGRKAGRMVMPKALVSTDLSEDRRRWKKDKNDKDKRGSHKNNDDDGYNYSFNDF